MNRTIILTPFLLLAACGEAPETTIGQVSEEIVNGVVTDTAEFQAVAALKFPGRPAPNVHPPESSSPPRTVSPSARAC
jgi:hypothetical protein